MFNLFHHFGPFPKVTPFFFVGGFFQDANHLQISPNNRRAKGPFRVLAHPSCSIQRCYPNSSLVQGSCRFFVRPSWGLHALKLTAQGPENRPDPKRKFHLPIIHFQEKYLSFRACSWWVACSPDSEFPISSELHLASAIYKCNVSRFLN